MSGLILTAEDRALFPENDAPALNNAVHRRMNVLLLLDDGWEPRRVAEALYQPAARSSGRFTAARCDRGPMGRVEEPRDR